MRPLSRRDLLAGVTAVGATTVLLKGCATPSISSVPETLEADAGSAASPWEAPDSGSPSDSGTAASGSPDAGPSDGGTDGGVTPQCEETEDNILGPYYRPNAPFRTVLASPSEGEWLILSGTVSGKNMSQCAVLSGALLDVWQANAQANYDMTDLNFPWRGRMYADSNGNYSFETILPGRYLNGGTFRPRHIHLKVSASDHVPLTTQLYFEGDPFIASDPFVLPSLVIPLTKVNGVWRGTFPIVLAQN